MNIKKKLITSILVITMAFSSLSAITVSANWEKTDDSTKYVNSKGEYATGWLTMKSGNKYYFKKDGSMVTGWLKIGDNKYYFKTNGIMAVGNTIIDKKIYEFDSEGIFVKQVKNNLCKIDNKTYYCLKNGTLAKGMKEITKDGKKYCYYFGDKGYAISTTKTIDHYDYVFNANTGTATKTHQINCTASFTNQFELYNLNGFKVELVKEVNGSYEYKFSGTVTNPTDEDYQPMIRVNLYDSSNKIIFKKYAIKTIDTKSKGSSSFSTTVILSKKIGKCQVVEFD